MRHIFKPHKIFTFVFRLVSIRFFICNYYTMIVRYDTCGVEVVCICSSGIDVLHNRVHVHNVLV
jgi:hypothetical protein